MILVKPERNLTAREDGALAEKLAAYKAQLSGEELSRLVRETRELKEYQDTPSPKEALEKIPMLSREDIGRKAEENHWQEHIIEGVPVLKHSESTSGIGYLRFLFGTDRVPTEDLPYVGLLKNILGYVDTDHYGYGDLTSEIHLNTGGLTFQTTAFTNLREPGTFKGMFLADLKVLYDKFDFGCSMLGEILTGSKLSDTKRLGEILRENKSRARMKLENASHSAAVVRASSYFSPVQAFGDMTGGIRFYHFLEDTVAQFEKDPAPLVAKLQEVAGKLFTLDNLLVSCTAEEKGFELLKKSLGALVQALPEKGGEVYSFAFREDRKNEGFKTSSQVNYVARCGNFLRAGYEYSGNLQILKLILSYDYLWINLRVKGGAYGCMSGFGRSGESYFVSYRDPNLEKTNQVYEDMVSYLEQFDVDERDMTKYIIGTISALDTPMTPSDKGYRSLSAYLSGVTNEMLQKERDTILSAQPEDIRKLAGPVKAILQTEAFCVIGNEEQVEKDRELFGEVKALFRS